MNQSLELLPYDLAAATLDLEDCLDKNARGHVVVATGQSPAVVFEHAPHAPENCLCLGRGVPTSEGDRFRVQLTNARSETVGAFDLPVASLMAC